VQSGLDSELSWSRLTHSGWGGGRQVSSLPVGSFFQARGARLHADERNHFALPKHLRLPCVEQLAAAQAADTTRTAARDAAAGSGLTALFTQEVGSQALGCPARSFASISRTQACRWIPHSLGPSFRGFAASPSSQSFSRCIVHRSVSHWFLTFNDNATYFILIAPAGYRAFWLLRMLSLPSRLGAPASCARTTGAASWTVSRQPCRSSPPLRHRSRVGCHC
jgi:hypothetical protein